MQIELVLLLLLLLLLPHSGLSLLLCYARLAVLHVQMALLCVCVFGCMCGEAFLRCGNEEALFGFAKGNNFHFG